MAKRFIGLLILLVIASPLEAEEVITRWASGEVIATDTEATPNTIVIKTRNWKGLDFIVGAAVEKDTVITLNNKGIPLRDVQVGDKVEMVYERNLRVVAKSIKVKR